MSAFIAGVLMFLAPCTLPLVPAYLAFISGVKNNEIKAGHINKQTQKKIVINALLFVCGFTFVFISFGVLASALGSQVGSFRDELSQIGGLFIIVFGLMMLRIVRLAPLQKEYKIPVLKLIKPGHPSSSFLVGTVFAMGWTPCVGPVLASVILLATDSSTIVSGAFMLAVFSLGLAMPFMVTAFLFSEAEEKIKQYGYLSNSVTLIGGVFLIVVGMLLITQHFELIVVYGYKIFDSLHYDALYNYL